MKDLPLHTRAFTTYYLSQSNASRYGSVLKNINSEGLGSDHRIRFTVSVYKLHGSCAVVTGRFEEGSTSTHVPSPSKWYWVRGPKYPCQPRFTLLYPPIHYRLSCQGGSERPSGARKACDCRRLQAQSSADPCKNRRTAKESKLTIELVRYFGEGV